MMSGCPKSSCNLHNQFNLNKIQTSQAFKEAWSQQSLHLRGQKDR